MPSPLKNGGNMKKLFLALALLILSTHGAWAVCVSDTDKFDTRGWCIDTAGQLTPKSIAAADNGTGIGVTQGGLQLPVMYIATANTPTTLAPYQSGSVITDSGGVTSDTLSGAGSKFTLPRAIVGLNYTLTVGSKSTSTIDTLDTADTFFFSASGTGLQMGDSLKSPGQAGDHIEVVCTKAGTWSIVSMGTTWTANGTN